jgi:hypothetical protein
MATLVSREEVREENRRMAIFLVGVMIALAVVAIVTIVLTH